jgi:hypothetical protein
MIGASRTAPTIPGGSPEVESPGEPRRGAAGGSRDDRDCVERYGLRVIEVPRRERGRGRAAEPTPPVRPAEAAIRVCISLLLVGYLAAIAVLVIQGMARLLQGGAG